MIVSMNDVFLQRDDTKLLNNITWDVSDSQHWAVLGLNGSGKTSLLKIVAGYQWPTKGKVTVLGNEYGKINIPELRKSIGWVSNDLDERLLTRTADTALEVVLSGKYASIGLYEKVTEEDVERAMTILKQLNVYQLADKLYTNLSQGEKRRIVIARALMPSPKILILDEPCNGLDIYAREQLLATVQSLATDRGGPAIFYVTHQLEEIVPAISHILMIYEGEITAAGEKQRILTEPSLEETFQIPLSVSWKDGRPWVKVKGNIE